MTRISFQGIAAVEGVATGDGRLLLENSLTFPEGETLPLRFTPEGSHGGIVVGTISKVWRSGSEIRIEGHLHSDSTNKTIVEHVQRVKELSDEGLAGLSVGLDDETVEVRVKAELLRSIEDEDAEAPTEEDEDGRITVASWSSGDEMFVVTSARIREVSIVDQPALVEGRLDVKAIAASNGLGPVRAIGAALTLGQDVKASFANPEFGADGESDDRLVWQKPLRSDEAGHWGAPLTVTPDGEVYGHLATKGRCHGAYQDQCINLDSLDPSYSFDEYLTGEAVPGIRTGPIVLNTSHSVRADGSIKDFDWLANTGDAVADVTLGVDAHGVWVAGRVRPGVSEKDLANLRGSALSGEWLPNPGRLGLRLAGILAVNNPGYAIARKPVAASNGNVHTFGPVCSTCGGEDPVDSRFKALEDALALSLMRGL